MKYLANMAFAALLTGGAAIGSAAPANAEIGFSVGIGPGYDDGYYGYDYYRPCSYYRYYDLPAPARCYRDYYGYYGSDIFLDGDFVFRDRDDFGRWRDRDDFRHWRSHDFGDRGFHGEHAFRGDFGRGGHEFHGGFGGGAREFRGGGGDGGREFHGDGGRGWGGHGDGGRGWGGHGDGGRGGDRGGHGHEH